MNYYYPLASVIEVSGRDAARYLQARLSNDIASLKQGENILAAALNHQGKPLALFNVYLQQERSYLLIADGPKSEKILSALLQFKVADDVQASYSEDYKVVHVTALPESSDSTDISILKRQRISEEGYDIICKNPGAILESQDIQLFEDEIFKCRALSGYPEFPAEVTPEKILTESGMKEAVSFRKGCYIGQEVLERIDSQGKAPSILLSYKSTIEVESGDKLSSTEEQTSGSVVSTKNIANDGLSYSFVRLRNRGNIPQTLTTSNGAELLLIKNRLSLSD